MSKSKKKEPIVLVEISVNADERFEIKLQKLTKESIPVIVGLLEKVKFDLLARDYDEDAAIEEDSLPIKFMNNKFDA